MAAEISEITDSNQPDILGVLEHVLTDLHDVARELHRQGRLTDEHHALLTEFRPLLDQFRTPAATMLASRRARKKAAANGRD
jgi:hypothetical protein